MRDWRMSSPVPETLSARLSSVRVRVGVRVRDEGVEEGEGEEGEDCSAQQPAPNTAACSVTPW